MKVILGNKVWVQKYNINSLMDAISDLDISISNEILERITDNIFVSDQDTMYEFEEYEGVELVEFFKNLDFIIDYDDFKGKPAEEVLALGDEFQAKANEQLEKIEDEKEKQIFAKKIYLTVYDIKSYYWYLAGKTKFDIPTVSEPEDGTVTPSELSQRKPGFLRLLRDLFEKN